MAKKASDDVTEQDADALHGRLKELADEWRERLKDPVTREMIKSGKLAVSPLVLDLVAAYDRQELEDKLAEAQDRRAKLQPMLDETADWGELSDQELRDADEKGPTGK